MEFSINISKKNEYLTMKKLFFMLELKNARSICSIFNLSRRVHEVCFIYIYIYINNMMS